MITIFKILFALYLILLFAACSGHPVTQSDQKTCPLQNKTMGPQWACEPQLAGGIAAVGVEPLDPHDHDAQQPRATKNANDALKRQVHFKVKRIFKNFSQLTGLGTDELFKELTQSVSQKVAQQVISDATEMKLWVDPSNKDMYLLVAVTPEVTHRVTKKEILDALKADKDLWKEIDDKDALDKLLPEIKKEMQQTPNL